MPRLKIGPSELYYDDAGDGPALVLAHGVGGNHAAWHQQTPVLRAAYRVITFDHRGFGLSTDVEGLGRGAFVSDLLALLDHLGVDQAVLVGQSMGGGTCVAFAAAHPERVRALVLASSLHAIAEPPEVAASLDAARATTAGLSQMERVLDPGFRHAHPERAELYTAIASFNRTDRQSLNGAWPRLTPPEAVGGGKPVLLLAGLKDPLFPIDAVRQVHAAIPGAFLVEVDAGHSVFFEQPTAFNDSVLSFLAACGIRGVGRSAHSNTAGYSPTAT